MIKKRYFSLLSLAFFTACSTVNTIDQGSKFDTKSVPIAESVLPQPSALISNTKLGTSDIPKPDLNLVKSQDFKREETKVNFDIEPPEREANTEGRITVIYKNNYKIRLDKSYKSVKSKISQEYEQINEIFKTYGLEQSSDLSLKDETEEQLDVMQKKYFDETGVDIPHLQSIHYYKFPDKTDIKALCRALKKLPFVRLAYPTSKAKPASTITKLANTYYTETTNTGYQNPYNNYYFQENRIYKGQDYFNSKNINYTNPFIGVVDTESFNPTSPEVNYMPGAYIYGILPWEILEGSSCPSNNCIHDTSSTGGHGEIVASVVGAKSNNIGTIGVFPGSSILPVRVYKPFYDKIARGIRYAADKNVHAINVSLVNIYNDPIYYESDVNAAISYARTTKNIPVAVSAGNYLKALQNNILTDAVVVGGTMKDPNNLNRYVAWIDSSGGTGSNYFSGGSGNPISLAAAAKDIGVYVYNPSLNSQFYGTTSGTSVATPMVATTMAMMKILNSSLSVPELKNIVTYSSTLRTYSNSQTFSPSRYLGKYLELPGVNDGLKAGIRDLNVYNAIVIAYNKNFYSHITRLHNVDDYLYTSHYDTNTSSHLVSDINSYGDDSIYGYNLSPNTGYLTFFQKNTIHNCTYGYQVYSTSNLSGNIFDYFGGVQGVSEITTNCTPYNSWVNNLNYAL